MKNKQYLLLFHTRLVPERNDSFMRVTGKSGLGDILGKFLKICFWGGILLLAILPFALHALGLNLNATALVIYPNGIVLLMIAHKFIKLFDSLKNENPFCEENEKTLRSAGILACIEAGLWLFDLIYEIALVRVFDIVFIVILIFLCALFLAVWVALYILAELFKEAIAYKKENELTI